MNILEIFKNERENRKEIIELLKIKNIDEVSKKLNYKIRKNDNCIVIENMVFSLSQYKHFESALKYFKQDNVEQSYSEIIKFLECNNSRKVDIGEKLFLKMWISLLGD